MNTLNAISLIFSLISLIGVIILTIKVKKIKNREEILKEFLILAIKSPILAKRRLKMLKKWDNIPKKR